MRAVGFSGTLRVGYQWAADLSNWEITVDGHRPAAFVFRSTIVRQHQYWVEQSPLDLVLTLANVEWLWRDVDVRRDGDSVLVVLKEMPIVSERAVTVDVLAR